MDVTEILSSDPEVMSGAVVFRGTRVPASALFEYLEAGDTINEFLLDFPTVERFQVEGLFSILQADVEASFGPSS